MAMNGHEQNETDEPQLPARLSEDLKSLYTPPRLIPPHIDDAVLAAARGHLAAVTQRRRIVQFPRWLAAAAVVALAAVLASLWFSNERRGSFSRIEKSF